MKKSKYLEFFKSGYTEKTKIYDVLSKHCDSLLGHIKWYGAWRQYCFFPSPNCVFNMECMQDIQDFIGELMTERKRIKGA